MDGEIISSSQSSLESKSSAGKISILVVDDDTTCLSIVAAILKIWKYEVVTVRHAIDALCTLRIKGASFDLVVSDVHMPDMNGFELQKQIDEEFNLPVVLMSADDKEGVILKGLENGAALFLVKPISPDDLKNLWQYAVSKKKGKPVVEEPRSVQGTSLAARVSNKDIDSVLSANKEMQWKKDPKRKVPRKDNDEKEEDNHKSATAKKAKVVWTNALHNRFLEAIRNIGLERAVPKKILELMKVPGLTRENVASHLQKYRIFLKRVSDSSYKIHSTDQRSLVDHFQSSLDSEQPSLMLQQSYLQYSEEQQMKSTSFERRSGKHVPVNVKALNLEETLNNNSLSRPRYGQSYLVGNYNFQKTMYSTTSPINQANRFGNFRVEPNNYRAADLVSYGGNISSGGKSIPIYQQKTSPPKSFSTFLMTNGMSNCNSTEYGRMAAFNSYDNMNPTFLHCDCNYAGYRMASDGIVGSGHMGGSNDFNGNWAIGPILSENGTGHLAQGMSSSAGFVGGNQFSSSLAIDQQESDSVLPLLLPTQQQQQNCPGDEGEDDDDCIFGLMNHCSNADNDSLQHGEDDLSISLLNLQGGDQEILNPSFSYVSYHVEDNPQGNEQSIEQQGDVEEDMGSDFSIGGHYSADYFPWFDQNPKQEKGHGELVDHSEEYGTHQFNNTISRSHLDDEEFIETVFSSDAFGGSYGHGGL